MSYDLCHIVDTICPKKKSLLACVILFVHIHVGHGIIMVE